MWKILQLNRYLGWVFWVLFGTLRWQSVDLIGFQCHTGIDTLDYFHISHKIKSFYLSLNVPNFPLNVILHSTRYFLGVNFFGSYSCSNDRIICGKVYISWSAGVLIATPSTVTLLIFGSAN